MLGVVGVFQILHQHVVLGYGICVLQANYLNSHDSNFSPQPTTLQNVRYESLHMSNRIWWVGSEFGLGTDSLPNTWKGADSQTTDGYLLPGVTLFLLAFEAV